MKSMPMTIPSEIESSIRAMVIQKDAAPAMIARMKALGLSKPHSIKLLRTILNLSLEEAKKQVHFSTAWSEQKTSDEEFQDDVYRKAGEAGLLQNSSPRLKTVA